MIDITPARAGDEEDIHQLLVANDLPLDGLAGHLDQAFVARQDGRVVGAAALEVYEDGGLLRSVVVDDAQRGTGVARQLVDAVLARAHERRLPAVYLLTTTAANYFPKLGFATITREAVPPGVQRSIEFTSACPASATVMVRTLRLENPRESAPCERAPVDRRGDVAR